MMNRFMPQKPVSRQAFDKRLPDDENCAEHKCDTAQARVLRPKVLGLQAMDLGDNRNAHALLASFAEEQGPVISSYDLLFERDVCAATQAIDGARCSSRFKVYASGLAACGAIAPIELSEPVR